METQLSNKENGQNWDYIFIVVEGENRTVQGGWPQWWCRFNTLISAQEERRRDEVLTEDEAKAAGSFWLHGKRAWHSATAWWRRLEEKWHRRGVRDETMLIELTRILLDRKMKKIYAVNSVNTNERWRFKQLWVNFFLKKIYICK
jgi:hypothetical protein